MINVNITLTWSKIVAIVLLLTISIASFMGKNTADILAVAPWVAMLILGKQGTDTAKEIFTNVKEIKNEVIEVNK
jgi:hypothetical protein